MKVAADTNVLLRAAVRDDPRQATSAAELLRAAELITIPIAALCEFAWVMRSLYKKSASDVARSIRSLVSSPNVVTHLHAVETGLAVLDAGGDFADGAIAYEGHWLGAEEFISFDKQAVNLIRAQGHKARLLS